MQLLTSTIEAELEHDGCSVSSVGECSLAAEIEEQKEN